MSLLTLFEHVNGYIYIYWWFHILLTVSVSVAFRNVSAVPAQLVSVLEQKASVREQLVETIRSVTLTQLYSYS